MLCKQHMPQIEDTSNIFRRKKKLKNQMLQARCDLETSTLTQCFMAALKGQGKDF